MIINFMDGLEVVLIGFVGGLSGTIIALTGVKTLVIKHYLRYARLKDYDKLQAQINQLANELKKLSLRS